jgi:hypothetical protein
LHPMSEQDIYFGKDKIVLFGEPEDTPWISPVA